MNKETVESEVVDRAHKATQRIKQPSWAAHCMALGMNLDEAEREAEGFRTRPTIKVKTPPYDFKVTPLCTPVPIVMLDEKDLEWDTE